MLHYRFITVLYRRIIWYNERFPHILQGSLVDQPEKEGAGRRLRGRVRLRRAWCAMAKGLIMVRVGILIAMLTTRHDGNCDDINDDNDNGDFNHNTNEYN